MIADWLTPIGEWSGLSLTALLLFIGLILLVILIIKK